MSGKWLKATTAAALVMALSCLLVLQAQQEPPPRPPAEQAADADKLFDQKNYQEAADIYERLVEAEAEGWYRAAERLMMCRARLALYDDALVAAEDYIKRAAGTRQEARAERLTAHLYMLLPHWGTRSGGVFKRGVREQGIFLQSWQHDKKLAVGHMERARDLYAEYDEAIGIRTEEGTKWLEERIECLFDLANLLSRFTIYDDQPHFWYRWWGERDDTLAETAGEDDFDEGYSAWEYQRKRPIGLKIGPDGKPIFPTKPDEYAAALPDERKILYVLDEVRGLDITKEKRHAALSYYRQAMLARKRFGMDRLNGYAGAYWLDGKMPLQEEMKEFNPWELGDGEALVLAGGTITRVDLPPQFDVLGLLRTVAGDYAESGVVDQSRYAVGVYYQSRQQYLKAIAEYEALMADAPQGQWRASARDQIARIKAPQVQLSQTGVQLPGLPADVQISYRNMDRIRFVARRIDVKGLLEDVRAQAASDDEDLWRYANILQSWHQIYTPNYGDQWHRQLAVKHLGPEVARWSAPVENDGTHRYAHTTLRTPLADAGAYLVYAYTVEPPAAEDRPAAPGDLGLGQSRAVLALTDLALVEKTTSKGNLYFVAHAATGAPVPEATVSVFEQWTTRNRLLRKNIHHTARHEMTTDENGMAVFALPKDRNSRLHLMVEAPGNRLAWSGMSYWRRYNPSRMQQGLFAYTITDRPVYRPGQTVRFKVWLRQTQDGAMGNTPRQQVTVTAFDPRGNEVHKVTKRTDEYGGLDGEFALSEEPPLGMYRLQVQGRTYAGGGNFRVEEYKKPEFEVTVEPDKSHAKLGERVTAVIRADYYFGAPVTDATVTYRVFREEYSHSYYAPGAWDWLYGPGYGWSWYERDWFPWWSGMRTCWSPPRWWWGYQPRSSVRELVQQGETTIGEDGTVEVEIDTAPALRDHPDRDHRYVVQAEVRDASRRVITGEGAVKVTRQAYYAMVQSDRGYYRPGEEMVVTVRCLTPDNKPVETEGLLTVTRVVFGGPDNAHIEQEEVKRWAASTDERGLLTFRLRHERSDQLQIKFAAPDQWGGTVEGYEAIWVCGRDFDGKLYRFNDLELITDKRTYRPGEVCHLMVNTKRPDSYVLLADKVDSGTLLNYRLLHVEGGHTIIDVPITEGDKPNTFVEALTVGDLRVHQQVKRLCVPPEGVVADVTVTTDKPEYKPGEEATVKVTARTPEGEPAQVQTVLSAFDQSVLYIQPLLTPAIAKFFHGRLRQHHPYMQTSLIEQFAAWGYVHRPFQQLVPLPPGWTGTWGVTVKDWAALSDEEFAQLRGGGVMRARGARRMEMAEGNGMMLDAVAAPAMEMRAAGAPAMSKAAAVGGAGGEAAPAFVEAEVRKEFADTALWVADLVTDENGEATVTFEMPENLTTWQLNAWAVSRESRVGQAHTEAVTTKDLLVRLQAPRFFMERDEVVVSANVHNYLAEAKTARVSLEVPAEHLGFVDGVEATVDVEVPAGGERRVDWRVKVLKEGTADITVKALTDEESDAMQMTFPVLVHGMTKQEAWTGSAPPTETPATRTVKFTVPEERRPELTRLEVQFAPSLVGAMMDALPYCLDYPYGCTEQTVSRFLPAVLTLKTLGNMGIDLEDVRQIRGRMAEVRRVEAGENRRIYADNPIFDSDELQRLIDKGLDRIANMQHGDGGWGWWTRGSSSGYLTSYVLYALASARESDVAVDENMLNNGMQFLRNWEIAEMAKKHWEPHATHAFVAYVLSTGNVQAEDCVDRLFDGRDKLGLYGKALLSLALANLKDDARARLVLRNIKQYLQTNDETQVAWFRTPQRGWWYWYNSDIETNAWCLRALVRLEPNDPAGRMLVKWLLENRRNGYYWRSTRDTTLCVAAMSEFVLATGEGKPDYTLTLNLDDGAVVKQVKINSDNFFTYDNRFVVDGLALGSGEHTLTITKDGPGALYYSAYLRNFTKEEGITAAGLQLKVDRTYFALRQMPFEVEVQGAEGQKLTEQRLRYERVPLKDGDRVESGDVIQVELRVTSDNDYTYLVFEDPKPAGCEPTEVRSGGEGQEGFWSYMELRDEKVAFFVQSLGRGEHLLRYRLRAEIPGTFHALPAIVQGMYVPELRGNSDEAVIGIDDR